MAWAVTVIGVIGIGVPAAAWLIARHVGRRQVVVGGLGPSAGAVDTWLIETYHLPALQRWQVRDAVVHGREMVDPALRRAAHDLAGCALRGELSPGRGLRVGGVVMMTEGAVGIVMGVVLAAAVGGVAVVAAVVPVLFGVRWMVRGAAARRIAQQGPTRAHQLNA
jgi:hypothetical protein